MDKSFGGDESCAPHDFLSSTVLVGDEDHQRTELKFSPIFGDTSPSGRVGLRLRANRRPIASNSSQSVDQPDKHTSSNPQVDSFDFSSSGYRSEVGVEESNGYDHTPPDKLLSGDKENDSEGIFKTPSRTDFNSTKATNPFENAFAESLSCSIFSPGILAELSSAQHAKETPTTSTGEFKWSIEHMAILHPVDIPEEDIVRSRVSPGSFTASQTATDLFWRSNIYHPSPDIRKEPTPLSAISAPSSKRLRPIGGPPLTVTSSSPSIIQPSPLTRPPFARRVVTQVPRVTHSSQTMISIPPNDDIDLLALLGSRYAFSGSQEECADNGADGCGDGEDEDDVDKDESASNLSLRRRLFLNDPDEDEELMETSAMASEAKDILTPLSSESASFRNRYMEDLGAGASQSSSSANQSASPSRLPRPSIFPDFSPIIPQ